MVSRYKTLIVEGLLEVGWGVTQTKLRNANGELTYHPNPNLNPNLNPNPNPNPNRKQKQR